MQDPTNHCILTQKEDTSVKTIEIEIYEIFQYKKYKI